MATIFSSTIPPRIHKTLDPPEPKHHIYNLWKKPENFKYEFYTAKSISHSNPIQSQLHTDM